MTELNFKGKEFVYNHHLAVPFRPLVPDESKGIGPVAFDRNLIVHGDNLHALKALMPLYTGKVDCIFIDPPYNTGKEGWCYNDNVNAPMIREWLNSNPVGIEDGLRHDKWCAMMWPRLRLLHELLSEMGNIWITLDGNEVHRAKLMLDLIFGEEHGLGTLVWEKSDSPRMDADTFSTSHDFILAYAKSPDRMLFQRIEQDETDVPTHYNRKDARGRSYYLKPLRAMGGQGETREARPNLHYPLTAPDGSDVYPKRQDGSDGAWRWSKDKAAQEVERIEWREGRNGWTPYFRIYADTLSGRPPETIWYHRDVGSSRTAKAQVKQIFSKAAFDTPKPLRLVGRVVEIASVSDSIIIDSFAGSATTGHAVIEANKRDGGNRRFILVEMEDYADSLTAERVRRVINGYTFRGTQRTELLREKLTWSKFIRAHKLLETIGGIENLHGHEYDAIRKTVKNGDLIVTGEKAVEERAEGLGGSFTYCESEFHLGATEGQHVWLIYRPDLDWLKSPEAALTLKRAKELAATDPEARHLVFAPARYVSQKMLAKQNIPVEFIPLPFALYRIDSS
ncbi:MAG: site-specific DNA-methyltransferase [Aestuariivita sp.]|nr:site-specific DNA-methyltransferase [Aestuariivita sp.]MCY4202070.1 site-specific DNA-methyltransferase [Aestuariivita sp.]